MKYTTLIWNIRHINRHCVKVFKYDVISGPNTGKHGPEITPYLDIFHAVKRNSYRTYTPCETSHISLGTGLPVQSFVFNSVT